MKPFFIIGLPRSRTRWMAEYFNGLPDVTCLHQASNGCYSKESLLSKLAKENTTYVGNSDAIASFLDLGEYPTVIIERSPTEVIRSLQDNTDANLEEASLKAYEANYLAARDSEGLRVDYYDIDDRLQEIHEYLIDVPFNPFYAERCKKTKVECGVCEKVPVITYNRIILPAIKAQSHTS